MIYKRNKYAMVIIELTNNIYSNDNATKHAELLRIKNIFDYTKPESLIRELISIRKVMYSRIRDCLKDERKCVPLSRV